MQQVEYVELRQESSFENYSSEMLVEEYNRLTIESVKLMNGLLNKLDEKIGDK